MVERSLSMREVPRSATLLFLTIHTQKSLFYLTFPYHITVRMAERSKALRSGRSPLLWAWVRIPLLTFSFIYPCPRGLMDKALAS